MNSMSTSKLSGSPEGVEQQGDPVDEGWAYPTDAPRATLQNRQGVPRRVFPWGMDVRLISRYVCELVPSHNMTPCT